MSKIVENTRNEFWYNVADQDDIPIAGDIILNSIIIHFRKLTYLV
jgi:hypothetical protein